MIKFNSKVVGSEVEVKPGSPLDLKCEGDGPVNWQTRLPKHRRFISKGTGNVRTFKVENPSAEFTGTYKCFYTGPKYSNLTTSVHVYVKGELRQTRVLLFCVKNSSTSVIILTCKCLNGSLSTVVTSFYDQFFQSLFLLDPDRVFWTSSTSLRVVEKEGEKYLLPCLLTDPAATDLGLRMDNGTTVPPGMNFTVYRHHGILIHSLHPSFNADYVCTARVKGVEKTSRAFSINVIQSETTCLLEMMLTSLIWYLH